MDVNKHQRVQVRNRIAERKRKRSKYRSSTAARTLMKDLQVLDSERVITYDLPVGKETSFFRRDVFLFKLLVSFCLVLLVAILFKTESTAGDPLKRIVAQSFTSEFQFAKVSGWFEDTFGQPLVYLPQPTGKKEDSALVVPASGKILAGFDRDGQGILVQTSQNTTVESIDDGVVIFSGTKQDHGKTIIVQHTDNSESWYGNLGEVKVGLYSKVTKGTPLGVVSISTTGDSGEYFFAYKKGDSFIDPIQVISFE